MEILKTWISISSLKYFRVVRIEKQIHSFFLGRGYSSTILFWDLLTFRWRPRKKSRFAGPEVFLRFEADLDFQKSRRRLKGWVPSQFWHSSFELLLRRPRLLLLTQKSTYRPAFSSVHKKILVAKNNSCKLKRFIFRVQLVGKSICFWNSNNSNT